MDKIKVVLSPGFSEDEFFEKVSGITFYGGRKNIAIHDIDINKEKLTGIQEALRKNILLPYDKATLAFVNGNNIDTKNIVSVATIANKNVVFGTSKELLALPNTVEVTLDDELATKKNLAVVWDNGTPAYNGNVAQLYNFEGTITLDKDTKNPSNLKAKVAVTVENEVVELPNVVSVASIPQIDVANGTTKAKIGLPETVSVTFDKGASQDVAVKWGTSTPAYKSTTEGTYTYKGSLELGETATNTNDVKAEVVVSVAAAVEPEVPAE